MQWLEEVSKGIGCANGFPASEIHLVGDLFDFWFEYRRAVPKGGVRLMGTIARLTDGGLPIHLHVGNHDLWTFGYLEEELGVSVHRTPRVFPFGKHHLLIGHGDGLGPGDWGYKRLKRVFTSPLLQKCFQMLHPDWGIGLADRWSKTSRRNTEAPPDPNHPEREWIWHYCKDQMAQDHRIDACFFGHRHHPLELAVPDASGESKPYINLGDWIQHFTYGRFLNGEASLHQFRG